MGKALAILAVTHHCLPLKCEVLLQVVTSGMTFKIQMYRLRLFLWGAVSQMAPITHF